MSRQSDVTQYEPGVLPVLQSKDETKAFYNKIAKVYDLLAEHSEQPMREKGLELLNVQGGERILEIGFGTGHCLVEIANKVGAEGRVFGVDLSENMLEVSQALLQEEGISQRVELVCGDAASLPLADDSLDAIFTSFTLELFDTPEIPFVLTECMRVLKPGGRVVVVGLSKNGRPGVVVKAFEWTHRHFPNLMDCRPIYVKEAIEAAGFEVDATEVAHMWVPVEIVRAINPVR